MKKHWCSLLLLAWAHSVCAADVASALAVKPIEPAPDGERFLFIVDLSASIKKLGAAVRQSVFESIHSGLNGRMAVGDTYGVWTVAERTQAGVFPMQVWDAEQSLLLASRVAIYLRDQKLAGEPNFAEMLAKLDLVIKAAKDVNILIFTDGETPFKGTVLDAQANPMLKATSKVVRREKKPLIISVIARGGRVLTCDVTLAGQPLRLPERAPRASVVKAPPPPAPPRREIIITKPNEPAAPKAPDPAPVAQPPVSTAASISTSEPETAAEPVKQSPSVPSPALPRDATASQAGAPAPSPPPVVTHSTTAVATPTLKPQVDGIAEPARATVAVAEHVSHPEPARTAQPDSSVSMSTPSSASAGAPMAASELLASPVSNPVLATTPAPQSLLSVPGSLPVAAREPAGHRATPVSSRTPGMGPSNGWLQGQMLMIIGCTLAAIAVVLLVVVVRQLHARAQPSLITRSMRRGPRDD